MLKRHAEPNQAFIAKYASLMLIVLLLGAGYSLWQNWTSIILSSMQWQQQVSTQLSELLYAAKANSVEAGLSLVSVSFVYGVLHSLGPGHGKLIVSTYIATHPTKVKASLMLTVLSALLQALVAITLVSTLLFIFNLSMREVNDKATFLITLSFYSVLILGLAIVYRSTAHLFALSTNRSKKLITQKPTNETTKRAFVRPDNHHHHHNHNHNSSDQCGCGHKHFVDAETMNAASSLKEYIAIILSIGLRPCTGAIMVLLFSNVVDIYWLGILSVFVMAVGTALTASTIAIMTITGKQLVKRYLRVKTSPTALSSTKAVFLGPIFQLVCGGFFIFIGIVLLSSQPVGMPAVFNL